jgi:hypothetical protein
VIPSCLRTTFLTPTMSRREQFLTTGGFEVI